MKSSITVSGLVSDLENARLNCQALGWPVTTPADLPLAYQVALSVRASRIERGETPAGYKIGFTNRNIWPRYAVYAPIWGTVWQGSLRRIDAALTNSAVLSLQGLMEPRIEPEIVFCLREAPPPDCTMDQLVASFDWVAHGFEIVHTHFTDWKFTAAQAVADAGVHGLLLVGHAVKIAAGLPSQTVVQALAGLKLTLYGDGVLKEVGVGANVLDGPVQALLHFVRELRATPDAPLLKAGDVITTGTLTDAYPVQAGQTWHTEIDSAAPVASELQGLTVRFE